MAGTAGTASQAWYLNASLPTELQAWHPFPETTDILDGASLTYFTAWNASATTPQYAYIGEATVHRTGTKAGFYRVRFGGYVANASVSTTPVPKLLTSHAYDVAEVTPGVASGAWYKSQDLPAELAGFLPFNNSSDLPSGAWITYLPDWNPALTTPQAAYLFETIVHNSTSGGFYKFFGWGYVVNASVSTTPVPKIGTITAMTTTVNQFGVVSPTTGISVVNLLNDATGNGAWTLANAAGATTLQGDANEFLDAGHTVTGGAVSSWTHNGGTVVNGIDQWPNVTVSAT